MEQRRLQSQHSVAAFGTRGSLLSPRARKLRLEPAHRVATDLPATPWWVKRDALGEITAETGYRPVAFVKIDDTWTALRFRRS